MAKDNPNKARALKLAAAISAMTDEQRAELLQRAPIMTIDGRPLSGRNMMLAAMQCAAAIQVGGFRQWLDIGRAVRKGETALYIFAPSTRRGAAEIGAASAPAGDGAAVVPESVRFLMVPVFDISQTEPIPAAAPVAA